MQPEEKIRKLIEESGILIDRHRLAIMLYLSLRGKARFKDIAEGLGLSAGNLAHHLRILEERSYVKVDKMWRDMRGRVISLTPEGYEALVSFLSKLREV